MRRLEAIAEGGEHRFFPAQAVLLAVEGVCVEVRVARVVAERRGGLGRDGDDEGQIVPLGLGDRGVVAGSRSGRSLRSGRGKGRKIARRRHARDIVSTGDEKGGRYDGEKASHALLWKS